MSYHQILTTTEMIQLIIIIIETIVIGIMTGIFYSLKRHFIIKARYPILIIIIVSLALLEIWCYFLTTYVMYHTNINDMTSEFIGEFVDSIGILLVCLWIYKNEKLYSKWKMNKHRYDNRNHILSTQKKI